MARKGGRTEVLRSGRVGKAGGSTSTPMVDSGGFGAIRVPGQGPLWPIEGRHSRRDVLPGEIRATEGHHASGVDSSLSRRVHESGCRE